jgi:hypothetical protein
MISNNNLFKESSFFINDYEVSKVLYPQRYFAYYDRLQKMDIYFSDSCLFYKKYPVKKDKYYININDIYIKNKIFYYNKNFIFYIKKQKNKISLLSRLFLLYIFKYKKNNNVYNKRSIKGLYPFIYIKNYINKKGYIHFLSLYDKTKKFQNFCLKKKIFFFSVINFLTIKKFDNL